ncbi:MAG TPA: M48 family metalloprotease [Nitrososphaerales archaeon]|nr:M48 family metalloprotease [Nitrososphaerales archaeon]
MSKSIPLLEGEVKVSATDPRFLRILRDALSRPPPSVPRVTTVRSVNLSSRPTKRTVGLTRYFDVRYLMVLSRPVQTITFYSELLDALSDKAAEGVIAHELAHAWLNEHVRPEESAEREAEADKLAREWGFAPELDALDQEAETVQ